jgi:hypothetical protein
MQSHSLRKDVKIMKQTKLNVRKLQQHYQDKSHMYMYHGQMNML